MKTALLSLAFFPAINACSQDKPILFQHVRVFDGTQVVPDADVLIQGGKIKEVGVGASLPAGNAKVVDGTGKTLLPGLIDAHVHVHSRDTLEQALVFGVTTELDMMMQPRREHELKSEENDQMASFFSAGLPATVPGGHGTEYGFDIPTITRASDAQSFVDARLREGSDYIKLMYTAGAGFGRRERPTLSKETMAAVIAAAHERHRLAVVHIGSVEGARDAIEAGADGLAHIFHGPSSPKNFGEFVASHHAFVIPTLSVKYSQCGPRSAGERLLSDPNLKPYLNGENISRLKETFPSAGSGMISCKASTQAIAQLQAAGVPIVAGTDAPNPGTTYGASLHGELELYVEAGLTPLQALVSATSAPATAFHMPDRGRIAPGIRADLVLVNGHPDEDILATRNIVAVYKQGHEVDRHAWHH